MMSLGGAGWVVYKDKRARYLGMLGCFKPYSLLFFFSFLFKRFFGGGQWVGVGVVGIWFGGRERINLLIEVVFLKFL